MRIPTDAEIAAFTDLPKLRNGAAALRRILQIAEFDREISRSIRRTLALVEARIDELAPERRKKRDEPTSSVDP